MPLPLFVSYLISSFLYTPLSPILVIFFILKLPFSWLPSQLSPASLILFWQINFPLTSALASFSYFIKHLLQVKNLRSSVNSCVQILPCGSPVQGLRDEAQGTSLQQPAQATHTLGTVRNACLPGNVGTHNLDPKASRIRNIFPLERRNCCCHYCSTSLHCLGNKRSPPTFQYADCISA